MKVAVTGAAGFIGGHLLERLRRDGHESRTLDLKPLGGDDHRGGDHRIGDIRDPGALATLIRPGVDVVVHLAALAGVRPSLARPGDYLSCNAEGTLRVLLAAAEAGVRRVVLASSSSVYGSRSAPAREDDPLAPLSPYAASKVAAEALAASWALRGVLEVAVVRPFTVYGPGQRRDMAISRFLSLAAAGEPIPMWDFVRDFTYVEDVVAGISSAMTVALPEPFRAYNLGSGRPVSARDLVTALELVTGKAIRVRRIEQGSGEPARTEADPGRAIGELGFRVTTAFVDGLRAQSLNHP